MKNNQEMALVMLAVAICSLVFGRFMAGIWTALAIAFLFEEKFYG